MVINFVAFIYYIVVGIILGIVSAIKKNTFIDRAISTITLIISSIPSFTLVLILILVVGFQLRWLPPVYLPMYTGFNLWVLSLIIPITALAIGQVAHITRMVRGELIEILDSDFLLLAKVKGLNKRQLIFRHALNNSMAPILPTLTSTFILVLANSFIIEKISGIRGVANLFLRSIITPTEFGGGSILIDIPVAILICVLLTLMSLVIALLLDVLYRFIDPRVRIGARK